MVNTFLPYPDFKKCAKVLDPKRLCKQRVEAYQLINAINKKNEKNEEKVAWYNHPACQQWINYLDALKLYYNTMIDEMINRGYKNTMKKMEIKKDKKDIEMPWWLGYDHLHYSHQASLLRKQPSYYLKYFSNLPEVYRNKGYVWISHHKKEYLLRVKDKVVDEIFAKVSINKKVKKEWYQIKRIEADGTVFISHILNYPIEIVFID